MDLKLTVPVIYSSISLLSKISHVYYKIQKINNFYELIWNKILLIIYRDNYPNDNKSYTECDILFMTSWLTYVKVIGKRESLL